MLLRHFIARGALSLVLVGFCVVPIARGADSPPEDDSGKKEPSKGKKKDEGDGEQEKPESAAKCISHTTQARYVNGFDHLVHIQNDCDAPATCQVSTNVNPKVQTVTVPAHERRTVLTYRGSPASEFEAKVECTLSKK